MKDENKQQLLQEIVTRQTEYNEAHEALPPRLVIFPEGTTTNGSHHSKYMLLKCNTFSFISSWCIYSRFTCAASHDTVPMEQLLSQLGDNTC